MLSPTKENNRKLYTEARLAANCSQNDWARLFNLQPDTGVKHRQKGQPNVSAKEKGTKGVNLSECLAAELLRYFHAQGYDVKHIEFDENNRIVNIPRTDNK
ncbi:hypothetical protein [Alteromonas sp. 14N.309.X.WAT.G.H12]|uniref:hypothetical protein n=1 Tax=Alteromonas sp. 14N.309.X.WAT.G.H12 TaxID=3120824 RepID=UPI002FD72BC4